ncbi:DUF192 domain-containing protein [bacterium]|nr:DUF192 domain-containing protein [bacterium]
MPISKKAIAPPMLLVGIVVVAVFINLRQNQNPSALIIRNARIVVEIADTQAKQTQGLSGRQFLPAETGLLFVFDTLAPHGVWMKDMKFPIDIFWLDEAYAVIDMEENISPATYPEIFTPQSPAKFVLETNAGSANKYSIEIGIRFVAE